MFPVEEIFLFGALAGALAGAAVAALSGWARARFRFWIAGVTTFVGFLAWNLTLNATQAVPNFDVDAPVVRVSWADAGSGVFAFLVTALVLGLITDRQEPAIRVVGAAAIAALVTVGVDLFVL
jgi:hypothetical protein